MNSDSVSSPTLLAGEYEYKPISTLRRAMFIVIGTVSLGLGIIGAYVPGMPSTVFFLITIGCYARGSERMYRWLLSRTWLQGPLRTALTFSRHRAVPVRIKIFAQSVAWSSAVFLIFSGRTLVAQFMGIALATSCTVAMALIRTLPDDRQPRNWTNARRDMWLQLGYGVAAGGIGALLWMAAATVLLRFAANLALTPAFDAVALPRFAAAAIPFGVCAGAAYAAVRHALPRNQWLRGAALGLACALLAGMALWTTGRLPVNALSVMLGLASVVAGLATTLLFGQFERRAPAQALVDISR